MLLKLFIFTEKTILQLLKKNKNNFAKEIVKICQEQVISKLYVAQYFLNPFVPDPEHINGIDSSESERYVSDPYKLQKRLSHEVIPASSFFNAVILGQNLPSIPVCQVQNIQSRGNALTRPPLKPQPKIDLAWRTTTPTDTLFWMESAFLLITTVVSIPITSSRT